MQGDSVALQCFNEKIIFDIPARNNPAHLKNIFDSISNISPYGKTDIVNVLHALAERIHRRALIILISDLFTEEIGQLLDCFQHMRHRKHDLAVFHIIDQQELDLNFNKPTRFKDLEINFSIQTDPMHIKKNYQQEINSFLNKIKQGCIEYKVDYRFSLTSIPYEEHLKHFLLDRSQKRS